MRTTPVRMEELRRAHPWNYRWNANNDPFGFWNHCFVFLLVVFSKWNRAISIDRQYGWLKLLSQTWLNCLKAGRRSILFDIHIFSNSYSKRKKFCPTRECPTWKYHVRLQISTFHFMPKRTTVLRHEMYFVFHLHAVRTFRQFWDSNFNQLLALTSHATSHSISNECAKKKMSVHSLTV